MYFVILSWLPGCQSSNLKELPVIPSTPTSSALDPVPIQNAVLNACELISVEEWETIFDETPLFFEELSGGCRISNLWDTRSFFIGLYPEDQVLPSLRWFTQGLTAYSNDSEFLFALSDVLDQTGYSSRQFLDEQIQLYEMINFRTERLYLIGDYAMWISYHESLTNILEVLDTNRFLRVEAIGFYPVEARDAILEIGSLVLERTPENFSIQFTTTQNLEQKGQTPEQQLSIPILEGFIAEPTQINYGSLCANETSEVRVLISNAEDVYSVLFVYRLNSPLETNQNWVSVFMNQTVPGEWTKTINAESDFSLYQLTAGATVEGSIAILYAVDQVINSSPQLLITINPCGVEPNTTPERTETP